MSDNPATGVPGNARHGRYVYCVAAARAAAGLGPIGITGSQVRALACDDIAALVHDCPAEPYQSADRAIVQEWVLAHQRVVDAAWDKFGTVLPFTFDTIVQGETGAEADGAVVRWLLEEHDVLKRRLDQLEGRAEYGVQVLWETAIILDELSRADPAVVQLTAELQTKQAGTAYLYRQRLDSLLRQGTLERARACYTELYERIRPYVDDVRVGKTRKAEAGCQMIMNLSCLVHRDNYGRLGRELDGISHQPGFSVRFTGPWPPYSFVGGC